MPKPGDILCHKDYKFEDGSKKEKLFVLLNTPDVKTPCLVLKTTSQARRYLEVTQGCNHLKKVFFAPLKWQNCFSCDTYIQLPQIIEFSLDQLLKSALAKSVCFTNNISSDCLTQLKNCLRKFKDDISERHWKLIY